jgi:hypothetical protein
MVAVYPPMKKKVSAAAATSNPVATSSGSVIGPDAKITNVDWNGNILSTLEAQKIYLGQPGVAVTMNLANSYTNEELQVLGKILTKLSGKKFKDYQTVRTELATNYAGIEGDFNQVVDALTDRIMPGAGDADKYGTSVNTSVANYDPDVLGALIDQTYQATLGRLANKDEKKLRLAEIQKQIQAGTKTTTTTFKGGSKTVTQPGFSQERAGIEIAEAAKAEAPEDLESMNQINFQNFILKNMGA